MYAFTLKMATAMFAETLDNSQHSTRLNPECRSYTLKLERFQVVTAASMRMTVFWDVAQCSLVVGYGHFRGTPRRNIPEDSYLQKLKYCT
jgi:hypothetical protein